MVEVRPATPGDAAGVRRVATAAYRETYVDLVGQDGVETLLSTWYDPDDLRERFGSAPPVDTENGHARTFVAVDDRDRVVGYAGAAVPGSDAETPTLGGLPTLYVHPDRWGEGLGTRLFDRARSYLAEHGVERMRIRVFADNDVGRGFYEDRADLIEECTDELGPLDETVTTAVYETQVG